MQSEPVAPQSSTSSSAPVSRVKALLAVLALLGSIAACAQLIDFDDTQRASGAAQPTALPGGLTPPETRAALPTAPAGPAPMPTPFSIPTGVTPMPLPAPTFIPITPSSATPAATRSTELPPRSPGNEAWEIADGRLIALADTGIWTATSFRTNEVHHRLDTGFTLEARCRTTHKNSMLGVAFEENSGTSFAVSFDLDTHTWMRRSKLPASPIDLHERYSSNCAASMIDGTLVIATSSSEALVLLLSDDAGITFREREIPYPADWPGMDQLMNTNVEVMTTHDTDLVVSMCASYSYDFSCPRHLLRIDFAAIASTTDPTISWKQARGQVVHPSDLYAGSYLDFFSGAGLDNDAVAIAQIGDETWRMERYNVISESYLDYSWERGSWAAAPLGEPPAPFPRGLKPTLFPFGDTALAAVPLANLPIDSGPARHYTAVDWWRYDRSSGEWTPVPVPPTVPPHASSVGASGRIDGVLHLLAGNGAVVVPANPISADWDTVVGRRGVVPLIVGDRMLMLGRDGLWGSEDRGGSWQPAPYANEWGGQYRPSCRGVSDGEFAFPILEGLWAREFVIASPAGQRVVSLRRRAQVLDHRQGPIPTCTPLRFDGAWHFAHLEGDRADRLVVQSVTDDDQVTERQIDLAGVWADAIPTSRTYVGTVDLYRHGDRIIVRICTVNEGAQCRFTDLSFHRSLLVGSAVELRAATEASTSPPRFYPPNDHPFGAAEELVQLGDQVWRSDHDVALDDCMCAEGGDYAPYYSWVGGLFDGEAEKPLTRTVDFRLFNGRVARCGSDAIPESALIRDEPDFVEPDTTQHCETRNADGTWKPVFGPIAVDWATVPAGTEVTFAYRDEHGRIFVTPTGG